MLTHSIVKPALRRLSTVFPQKAKQDDLGDAYLAALSDLPRRGFEKAVAEHIREGRFFPRPSELRARAAAYGDPERATDRSPYRAYLRDPYSGPCPACGAMPRKDLTIVHDLPAHERARAFPVVGAWTGGPDLDAP